MKVTNEKTENRQAFLTIEVEPPEIEEGLEKSYKRLVRKHNIPGFRKGMAPRDVFERYVGRESLFNEALQDVVSDAYEKALKDEGLEAIAQPQIDISSTTPLVFKAVVPLKPTIKLGDYHQIRLTEESVVVKEEEVNAVMEQLRHEHAVWEPVERQADFNDMVVFDIKSEIGEKPFVNRLGVQYQLLKEQTFPVPGFSEQLVQMKAGETKQFKLSFPESHPDTEVAGKEASFEVKVNEVKQEKPPELNDEFAKQVNKEFATLSALRDKVYESLKKQAEDKAKRDFEQKVVDEVVKIAELEYPPVLVDAEIGNLVRAQLQQSQVPEDKVDDYLKAINKTREQLVEELRPVATRNVMEGLALGKVTAEEKIEVADSEIDAEVERMVGVFAEDRKEKMRQLFGSPQSRQSVWRMLISRKTLDKLVEIAKGLNTAEKAEKEGQ